MAPYEVELGEDTAVQPDVLVILGDRAGQITAERLTGPPSLAVEVVSYSSKRTDRLQKRALYMEVGVEEYWVADCDLRHVERWRPDADTPDVLTEALDWHPRPGAPPLTIDLPTVFRRVWR